MRDIGGSSVRIRYLNIQFNVLDIFEVNKLKSNWNDFVYRVNTEFINPIKKIVNGTTLCLRVYHKITNCL